MQASSKHGLAVNEPSLVQIMVVAWLAQSHYLNQCFDILNQTLRNILQRNTYRNAYTSFKKMHLKMSAKSRPFCLGQPMGRFLWYIPFCMHAVLFCFERRGNCVIGPVPGKKMKVAWEKYTHIKQHLTVSTILRRWITFRDNVVSNSMRDSVKDWANDIFIIFCMDCLLGDCHYIVQWHNIDYWTALLSCNLFEIILWQVPENNH